MDARSKEPSLKASICLVYVATTMASSTRTSTGTGFLIDIPLGGLPWFKYLLTNHHVIPNIETARITLLDFRNPLNGEITQCALNPDAFYLSNEALDFAVVAISSESSAVLHKQNREFLPLSTDIPEVDMPLRCLGYPQGFLLNMCEYV